jgi:hypothetical protein
VERGYKIATLDTMPVIGMFANANYQKGSSIGGPLLGILNMITGDKARTYANSIPIVSPITKIVNSVYDSQAAVKTKAVKKKAVKKKAVKKKAVKKAVKKNGSKKSKKKSSKAKKTNR